MMVDYIKTQLKKKTDHVGDDGILAFQIILQIIPMHNARFLGIYANR